MFTYKKENQLPIKSWIPEKDYLADEKMVEQVENLAKLPFAFHHIALSPDGHIGYGMPIGGVMATKGVIIPNAVGLDIGCGMCAVKTSLTDINTDTLKKIMGDIRKAIPVGFKKNKDYPGGRDGVVKLLPEENNPLFGSEYPVISNPIIFSNACLSLGTLGGGNHFIEIQKGNDGHIWIMIHSGSRNLGKQVAEHYDKLAKKLNAKWYSSVPKEYDLAFLPIDSEGGKDYIREMNYCVEFALANRKLMMERVGECFYKEFPELRLDSSFNFSLPINIAHNYAKMENHFKENVMVHRKGATLATCDTVGIIPGSQGTKSYIVRGLGNASSFNSCSHGAGRSLGRKQAIKTLDLAKEIKALDDQGIIHGIRNQEDLDEAPSAYKDIYQVMENQKDLVEVLVELTPLAVVKA